MSNRLFSIFGTAGYFHSDNGPSLISEKLRNVFLAHGIAYSNSTKYNPQGNGHVERCNGVVWEGSELALFSKNWPTTHWEHVIPVVLHSQRSLLCTATNETPHERLFSFVRRTASGPSLPSWILQKGPVLVKRHVRRSKYEPLVTSQYLYWGRPILRPIPHRPRPHLRIRLMLYHLWRDLCVS